MKTNWIAAGALGAALAGWLFVATLSHAADAKHEHGEEAPASEAVCVINPTEGHKASGVLMLTQTDKGVQIVGEISGLKPGEHGFHIHQFGDTRSADGASAGPHYNPHNEPHGGPADKAHHEGDLGNIKANGEGVAKIDALADDVHLHFIIGRSIVVHADADDLKTQPSGNSGKRIGVGVIAVAAPPAKK
jgi:Cu-Zn family superoxide dismutase